MARKRPGRRDSDIATPFLYFNVYTAFDQCDKFDTLCDFLNGSEEAAELILLRIWKAAASYFPEGNFGRLHPRRFASYVKWHASPGLTALEKTPEEVLKLLIRLQYLDKIDDEIIVHNWDRQALYRDRKYDSERKGIRNPSISSEQVINNSPEKKKGILTGGRKVAKVKENVKSFKEKTEPEVIDNTTPTKPSGGSPAGVGRESVPKGEQRIVNDSKRKEREGERRETPHTDISKINNSSSDEVNNKSVGGVHPIGDSSLGVVAFKGSNYRLTAEQVKTLTLTCYEGNQEDCLAELKDIDKDMLSGELDAPISKDVFGNILSIVTVRLNIRKGKRVVKNGKQEERPTTATDL